MIYELSTNQKTTLPQGKADFLLSCAVTYTCEIEGLTQAGIPGKIPLTPTLDAEFISTGEVYSLEDLAETASGIPTPALLTRAVENLVGFSALNILDLGLHVKPKNLSNCIDFNLSATPSISSDKSFDAKEVFEKGREFAKVYKLKGDYLILGESTPSGTTTAQASLTALGYDVHGFFASSFKEAPLSLKESTINSALLKLTPSMNSFKKLSHTSDATLMFCAGFILEASKRFNVVLAGATQMASVLLIADKLSTLYQIHFDYRKLHLCTTKWIAKDGASNINALLSQLNFRVKAMYADFLYEDANIPVLKLYDEGEAKEGVGCGAAIAYGYCRNITQKEITAEVERMMTEMMS